MRMKKTFIYDIPDTMKNQVEKTILSEKKAIFSPGKVFPLGKNCIGPAEPASAALTVALARAADPSFPLLVIVPDSALAERMMAE